MLITAADFTGWATLALAAATFCVVWLTRRLGNATERLAEATDATARATREAVEAIEEPFVIAVPTPREVIARQTATTDEEVAALVPQITPDIHRETVVTVGPVLRVRLWNIGSGPAIVTNVTLDRDAGNCLGDLPGGFRPIGAGQFADMEIPCTGWPQVLGDGLLTILYSHANGRFYETRSLTMIGERTITCLTYDRHRRPVPSTV